MNKVFETSQKTAHARTAQANSLDSRLTAQVNPWLLCLNDAPVHIVCFHAAGCQPTVFMQWRRYFSASVCVAPVVLPMHGSRLLECMPQSFQEIANNFIYSCFNLFSHPTILFGHSMGAMIAYEVACLLQQCGRQPVALVVSCAQSPDRREVVDRTIGLTNSEFLDVLRDYGSISEDLLHNREFLEYYLPIARTDFALCERYVWQGHPELSLPIHTFNGQDDTHISRDGIEQWNNFTRGGCTHHLFNGGHFYCDDDPGAVCARIKSILRSNL
jgi:surfactin synthase thioesterase subunit